MRRRVRESWTRPSVSKLSVLSKRLIFKQILIFMLLNFKNDGLVNNFYFLNAKNKHFILQFRLKTHSLLNNGVSLFKTGNNLEVVP